MKRRRNRQQLEQLVADAKTDRAKALAYYQLGLFHDNNGRESEAIPHYEMALELGLDQFIKARALAWLASSLYKTGRSRAALARIAMSQAITESKDLKKFLADLERRIKRVHP